MTIYDFFSGSVMFGFLVCALFFIRLWRRTRDELFLAFALSFGLLGLGQGALALTNVPTEDQGAVYLIRLVAFGLILVAIVRKNRTAS